jgi:arylformamidase
MNIIDISLTISPNLPVWPGDAPINLERVDKIEDGSSSNVTHIKISAHTGTHVDAPFHFLGGNSQTVEQLSLSKLVGRASVVHIPEDVDLITASLLKEVNIPASTRRLLLKTRNSVNWDRFGNTFQKDFVAISADGAQFLVDQAIDLVGVDYLSVAPYNNVILPHKILLQAGIVILEGLDLSQVTEGDYTLYCLPLKLAGADGAPARVILIDD